MEQLGKGNEGRQSCMSLEIRQGFISQTLREGGVMHKDTKPWKDKERLGTRS